MRCTQIVGLTQEALDFLVQNTKQITDMCCPHCLKEITKKADAVIYDSAKDSGMFEDGPELYKHNLQDGRIAREIVQAVPWSSGPCIFLCLEIDGKREFEWSEEELNNC